LIWVAGTAEKLFFSGILQLYTASNLHQHIPQKSSEHMGTFAIMHILTSIDYRNLIMNHYCEYKLLMKQVKYATQQMNEKEGITS